MPSTHLSWGSFRKYVTLGGGGGGFKESHTMTQRGGGVSQVASRDGRLMLLDNLDEYILHNIQAAKFYHSYVPKRLPKYNVYYGKGYYINDYYSESGMKY